MVITDYAQKEFSVYPNELSLKFLENRDKVYCNLTNIFPGQDYDTFEWVSSNTDIIALDNSTINFTEVIAKASGTARVTLNLKLNNEIVYTGYCDISSEGYYIKVTPPDVYLKRSDYQESYTTILLLETNMTNSDYDSIVWEPSTNIITVLESDSSSCKIRLDSDFSAGVSLSVYVKVYKDSKIIAQTSCEVHTNADGYLRLAPYSATGGIGTNRGFSLYIYGLTYTDIIWEVSNPNISTITQSSTSSVRLKPLNYGSTNVIATCKNGDEILYIASSLMIVAS